MNMGIEYKKLYDNLVTKLSQEVPLEYQCPFCHAPLKLVRSEILCSKLGCDFSVSIKEIMEKMFEPL